MCGSQSAATDGTIYERYQGQNVNIFEIGSNLQELLEFVTIFGCRFPGLVDGSGAQYSAYRVPHPIAPYPQDYIIDQEGRVAYWAAEYDPQEIMRVIDLLLWQQPPPTLNVTLTPVGAPITIPANGGSFSFNAAVVRAVNPQAPFWVWARMRYPNGNYSGPTLGPVQINPPVGVTVSRLRNQNIAGSHPAGVTTYLGYANTAYTYPAIDSSSFNFTKLTSGSFTPWVADYSCLGELFPGESLDISSTPSSYAFCEVNPNPFNPVTTIRYQIAASSHISLRVYDVSGRLVSVLVDGVQEAGMQQVTFDGSNLASGVYLYTLSVGTHHATGKMVLLK